MRAHAVSAFDDGAGVNDPGAAKEHEGDGDQERGLVDSGEKLVKIETDWIIAKDHFNASAEPTLPVIEVLNGWKFEIGHQHFVARAAEVKAGGDDGLRERDVLVQRDFPGLRANQRGDFIADVDGHLPPAFFPGANAAISPGVGVGVHGVVNAAGHRAQGVADEVGGAVEDREFGAVSK